jgi:2-phospho-L-lactate/phosphoenolpyruvate guanylyltransferase
MNPVDTLSMNGTGSLWAVVPAKLFAHTKRRLMPLLSSDERRTLAGAMLADVLSALMRAPCLAGVIVVTSERKMGAIAHAAGAVVMSDDENTDMNAAVAEGARRLAEMGQSGMLVIPADVPLITVADVEAIVLVHRAAPSITLVPATKDGGTNALACSPPLAVPCRFGEDSLRAHQEAARDAGITAGVVRLERVGLDIDRPDDLAEFLLRSSPTQSYAYLISSGIAQRLRSVDRCRESCRTTAAMIEGPSAHDNLPRVDPHA